MARYRLSAGLLVLYAQEQAHVDAPLSADEDEVALLPLDVLLPDFELEPEELPFVLSSSARASRRCSAVAVAVARTARSCMLGISSESVGSVVVSTVDQRLVRSRVAYQRTQLAKCCAAVSSRSRLRKGGFGCSLGG